MPATPVDNYRGDPKCPMAGTYSRNNPGKFPNRNYSKVNCLNAVIFDKPSEPDRDDEDRFDGLQYNPESRQQTCIHGK
jgi:hypothetical protein